MVRTTNNGYARIASRVSPSLTAIKVGGCSTKVRKGDAATLLRWVARQIHTGGIESASTVFGWRDPAVNASAGGIPTSNHLSGTAIDYNGGRHPYEATRPHNWSSGWSASDQTAIRAILEATSGTVKWGLDYGPGFRDAMHFEVKASATAVSRAAARLTTGWVTVSSDFLNGRSKPSTTAPIKFLRTKGFRIRFVEVAYREGRIWLRTKFNTWYAADLTTW
ncbi:M15 family metallopeptidase [Cellulomonas rhizosphaerae]|uniref:M15 family peptidase n=1 Tax=Cellulomonas rhizosphaerae TaxID=2293719 RepID=A0A413RRE7_9CELL|nr:M15 family metallopeptidase [Cellulomonas rhizosphaerae]RHA44481.1 M15 family peptidase [Cellulomonas rhizosphaerae]